MIKDFQNADCIEYMSRFPDGFFQLIIADPPYFEVKGDFDFTFKDMADYQDHVRRWAAEMARVLGKNGTLIWWGMFYNIAYAQVVIDQMLSLQSAVVWERPGLSSEWDGRRTLIDRGMERFLVYIHEQSIAYDQRGLQVTHDSEHNYQEIKEYLRAERERSGLSVAQIVAITNTYSSHYFSKSSQWKFPTENHYRAMQKTGFWPIPYEDLRQQYEGLRQQYEAEKNEFDRIRWAEYQKTRPRFNNDKKMTDVWRFPQDNYCAWHPTVKPKALTRRMISIYSNQGDNVLVPFGGSGTEMIEASEMLRNVYGCELDSEFFQKTDTELDKYRSQLKLFT